MGNIFDIIKRVGAILVILILIGMMGLMFSIQPIEEITRTIVGDFSAGEFDGEPISARDYVIYENACRNWMISNKLGQERSYLENCIDRRMSQIYSLAKIGERLSIRVNPETIKQEIFEQAKDQYEQQNEVNVEDRQSLDEIYRYNLSNSPMNIRLREKTVQDTYGILSIPLPQVFEKSQLDKTAAHTKIGLRVVYFNDQILKKKYKPEINVTEAEVEEFFQKEQLEESKKQQQEQQAGQQEQQAKPRKLTTADKTRIIESIKKKKLTEKMSTVLMQLNSLSGLVKKQNEQQNKSEKSGIEKVAEISDLPVVNLGKVSLDKLNQIEVPSNKKAKGSKVRLDLLQNDFLRRLYTSSESQLVGPILSGSYTVYAGIEQVSYADLPKAKREAEKNKTETQEKEDERITNEFLNYLMEEESRRGNFKVNHPKKRTQAQK